MSTAHDRDDSADEAAEGQPPAATEVHLAYAGVSSLVTGERTARLALAGNLRRDPVRFEATIRDPLRFREAMAALYAVVASDFRYVPKDRTAYVAYQRMRRESSRRLTSGRRSGNTSRGSSETTPTAFVVLDPVITVHPDQVLFEVFSRDEGAYAKLGVDRDAFEAAEEPTCGTTNIDFSPDLFRGLQQMRSYRETKLSIGLEGVKVATATAGEVLEKQVRVPDSWLRGFLQVQSSAALPRERFALAPVDLYNALRHLRLHADKEGPAPGAADRVDPGRSPPIGPRTLERGDPDHCRAVRRKSCAGGPALRSATPGALAAVPAVRRGGRGPRPGVWPAELLGPPRWGVHLDAGA